MTKMDRHRMATFELEIDLISLQVSVAFFLDSSSVFQGPIYPFYPSDPSRVHDDQDDLLYGLYDSQEDHQVKEPVDRGEEEEPQDEDSLHDRRQLGQIGVKGGCLAIFFEGKQHLNEIEKKRDQDDPVILQDEFVLEYEQTNESHTEVDLVTQRIQLGASWACDLQPPGQEAVDHVRGVAQEQEPAEQLPLTEPDQQQEKRRSSYPVKGEPIRDIVILE